MSTKRYKSLSKHPGIWKDILSNRYQARKKIRGKQFSKTFDTIQQAKRWKSTFNGKSAKPSHIATTSTLNRVWKRMQELHFPSLEKSTCEVWRRRWRNLEELGKYHMEDISSTLINQWITKKKKWFTSEEYKSLGRGHAGRCNLYNELNLFQTIFNWYKAEDEFEEESLRVTNPIRPRHKKMAFIRNTAKSADEKKIPLEDAFKFFEFLPELYKDLAMTQFFCAARISEIAGIQISNIDLKKKTLLIRESVSWCNPSKTFEYLKPYPKNREPRIVHIHSVLEEIIMRRISYSKNGFGYLFHIDGKPLNYCTIQVNYRSAQKKSGIKYTGSHCLRHGMATIARRVGGMGLDSVIAMTGHKDLKLADHYSKVNADIQKETSLKILDHIKEIGLIKTEETDCELPSNVISFAKSKRQNKQKLLPLGEKG